MNYVYKAAALDKSRDNSLFILLKPKPLAN
jgi:hypothetical protein